jgi:hypothetical protein
MRFWWAKRFFDRLPECFMKAFESFKRCDAKTYLMQAEEALASLK